MQMQPAKDHYSYQVYADQETAQNFDRIRFGGAIGEFLKQTQEDLVFSQLPDVKGWNVIDVGAGTGRFTIPFLQKGARVTACDASRQMLDVLQSKINVPELETRVVDAHELPFEDRTFDCAISFRILMHVIDWRKALSELCRVSKDFVIIDFPPRRGFLRFAPVFHLLKKPFQKKPQPYRVLPLAEIRSELVRQGFQIHLQDNGFLLPITFHRLVRSVKFSRSSEAIFRSLGLTGVFGSPVTLIARRTSK